jgi:2,4-dienoyl-CoA reductase-like NADH-dependent reductase (Old Yellow Enzyme family)
MVVTKRLLEPLSFIRGPALANRLALSPMTSDQAKADGSVTDDEARWIGMRALGGFGMVTTSASYVQPCGKGGAGQTGIWSDDHVAGLAVLARIIRAHGGVAAIQLHHAGMRASARHVPDRVAPSAHVQTGARALTTGEVEQLVEDFVIAAQRAERAGFDGVELHGAHGYLLAQFLSAEDNRRSDRYGGALANRARVIFEIIDGIRARCRTDLQLGLRLSPERWGMRLAEMRELAGLAMARGGLDWIDLSLWDARKLPEEADHRDRRLFDWFTDIPRHGVRLGVSGKIHAARTVTDLLDDGADLVFVGRAAILHSDWARQAALDAGFRSTATPVSADYLAAQGLGPRFIRYLRTFEGFVQPDPVDA